MMNNKKSGEWIVKYKIKSNGIWKTLIGEPGYWYADPMLFDYNGLTYLFVEAFHEGLSKGKLAVSVFNDEDQAFSSPRIIINKAYHLSYPEVFAVDEKVYMIPESSQNRTLEIYIATDDSLFKWRRKSILLDKCFLADPTVLQISNYIYIYAYEEKKPFFRTLVFSLDIKSLKVNQVAEHVNKKNDKRPAGNFIISKENDVIRPLQYNVNMYGEKIVFERIHPGAPCGFEKVSELDCNSLISQKAIIKEDGYYKIHTYNENGKIIVVDVLHDKEDKLSDFRKYIRKGRNGIFRIIKGKGI